MIAALLLALVIGPTQAGLQPERVAEIRVHGNATMSDAAVIALAGVAVGATLDPGGTDAIAKRLKDSGRFDEVQVNKRYRTLAMDEVALVLLVHEKPGVSASGQPPSVMKRLRSRLMFFPILSYDDGYGWTYGGRTTIVDLVGKGTHVSVPLSWGGTRRATVEADRTFHSGPLTRLTGSFGIAQRENPHYGIDDRRVELRARGERRLFDTVTLGAEASRATVAFDPLRDRLWSGGADVTLDTRRDPAYPSDAVLATAAWTRMNAIGDTRDSWAANAIDRYRLDVRGYKRLFRSNVLAVRVQYDDASTLLPPYEQLLLGGSTLRGLPAGDLVGDKRLLWGIEARVPFTSPLTAGRTGFNVFLDGGKVAPYGQRLADQKTYRGAGAGLFVMFAVIQLNLDVARSFDGRGTHVHFSTGFSF
jgi:outer membrane protein assembly factor BamA